MRTVYRPRGLVISTGEQLTDTQSLVAHLLAWLAAQWAHFSAVLPDSWRELRTKARREGQRLCLPESLASLYQSKK